MASARIHGNSADRTPPDPAPWKVSTPASGTTEALVLDFDEPMDHALRQRRIGVMMDGKSVSGRIELARGEMQWRFTPDAPWRRARITWWWIRRWRILPGNHMGRAFDADTFEKISAKITRKTVMVPFRVKEKDWRKKPCAIMSVRARSSIG